MEFVDLNKIKFESIKQVKDMFNLIDKNFKQLRYITIQQCSTCKNFIKQLQAYLDGNESLVRASFVMNKMVEVDCYETLKSCLEHPNIEIIQIAERPSKEVNEDEVKKKKRKNGRKNRDDEEDEMNESNVSIAIKTRLYKEIFVAF